jgi:hypothetical protein
MLGWQSSAQLCAALHALRGCLYTVLLGVNETPCDGALFAQVRVRLAERIDEIERARRKDDADTNWMAKQAEEMGACFL